MFRGDAPEESNEADGVDRLDGRGLCLSVRGLCLLLVHLLIVRNLGMSVEETVSIFLVWLGAVLNNLELLECGRVFEGLVLCRHGCRAGTSVRYAGVVDGREGELNKKERKECDGK